jgi:hypothetical protein
MASKRKPRWTAKHLNALLEYICRHPRMFFEPNTTVRVSFLVEQYGGRPLFDVCEEIAELFGEWRKLNSSESGDSDLSEYC